MKILVACEESQAVTIELRKLGHEAYSADILDCSGGHPEWHIKGDVLKLLDKGWDMMIAFPPCTHLAVSGARWFPEKIADGRQQQGIGFFMDIINAPIPKIAVENPIGIMSTRYRKPEQIIQPYEHGDASKKSTCLWLKNLPLLVPTKIVEPKLKKYKDGSTFSADYGWRSPDKRNKTYPGIAKAIAEQWTAHH